MASIDLKYPFEELPLIADKNGLLGLLADGTATIEIADTRDRDSWAIDRIFIIGHRWRRGAKLETGLIELEPKARGCADGWFEAIRDTLLIRKREEIQNAVDEALDGDEERCRHELADDLHASPL